MQNLTMTVLLAVAWCFAALLHAEEPSLEGFLARLKPLAQHRTIMADYTQTRHITDLDFDMVVTGRVAQEQDRRLTWMTDKPLKSTCLFTPETFRLWDAESGKTNALNAAKYPWIRLVFELQSAFLNGNTETLKKAFTMNLLGERTLALEPISQQAAIFFSRITITMAPDFLAVQNVVLTEPSGDTITIVFTHTQRDVPIPETTWQLP